MSLRIQKLGFVLSHIRDFPFWQTIFLPNLEKYEADTPCAVGGSLDEEHLFRQACLENGLINWLNVAVVSDTCEELPEKTVPCLIQAFNEDCREGGWLRKMMNYQNPLL